MRIQRLSIATFRVTSPSGRIMLIDPWLTDDPFWPLDERTPEELAATDIVAITHGHVDHFPGVYEIANANGEVIVVAVYELAMLLMAQGIKGVRAMNIGGSLDVDGIRFTAVSSAHSSGLRNLSTGESTWVGPPVGYVIRFEDGLKLYAAGDTGLHSDMKLIGDYYKPDIALVPVGGSAGMVMDAEQAVYAVTHFIRPRWVIPFHDFPEPAAAAIPELFEARLKALPQTRHSIGGAQPFLQLMRNHPECSVRYLAIGESAEIA